MDEFHYYADPHRGWAWQVPLLELPEAQFVLMSATLGDVTELAEDLTGAPGGRRRSSTRPSGRCRCTSAGRWSRCEDTLEELVETGQAPVYVVHFTQAARGRARDESLRAPTVEGAPSALTPAREGPASAERLATVRFGAGFGKTLSKLLRQGIGVHHAGMLPRYRRLVEQLAQEGLLTVICGTDTLGVGHQRADPHGAVHRRWRSSTGTSSGCCGPGSSCRSPAGPGGPASTPTGTSWCRRPSTSSRTRRPRPRRRRRTPR